MQAFQIENLDGYEIVQSELYGKLTISWFNEDEILVLYDNSSSKLISPEQAQKQFDSGMWTLCN